jgi:hypothetical protein
MRQAQPLACLRTTLIADMDLAGGDMCPYGATESLEVGQGDAGVAKPGRFADKLLGVAGATEKAVIAGNGDLAPASLRCTPSRFCLMDRRRPEGRIGARMGRRGNEVVSAAIQ